jgi:hypothetical protein
VLPFLTLALPIVPLLGEIKSQLEQRPSFVARMSEESLEARLLAAPDAPAPGRASARTPAPGTAASQAQASPAASTKVVAPAVKDGLDIPVIPVVGAVAAAFAAATFSMRSGKKEREAEQSSSPAPAPVAKAAPAPVAKAAPVPVAKADETDISVPYDAAARLAYDHSDKTMEYSKFKENYEAETVAYIKAKQKK